MYSKQGGPAGDESVWFLICPLEVSLSSLELVSKRGSRVCQALKPTADCEMDFSIQSGAVVCLFATRTTLHSRQNSFHNPSAKCSTLLDQTSAGFTIALLLREVFLPVKITTNNSMIELKMPIDRDIAPQPNHTRTKPA